MVGTLVMCLPVVTCVAGLRLRAELRQLGQVAPDRASGRQLWPLASECSTWNTAQRAARRTPTVHILPQYHLATPSLTRCKQTHIRGRVWRARRSPTQSPVTQSSN